MRYSSAFSPAVLCSLLFLPALYGYADVPSGGPSSAVSLALPVRFEPAIGPPSDGRFVGYGDAYSLLLSKREITAVVRDGSPGVASVVRMRFSGSRGASDISGMHLLPGTTSYYLGADPRKWKEKLPQYASVLLKDVYDGIDLICYGSGPNIEFDFVVGPGADPRVIRIRYDGADRTEIDSAGDLVLTTAAGQLRQRMPTVYQEINGERRRVESRYRRYGRREFGFELGPYDRSKTLLIDPVLVFSTYLGGSSSNVASAIRADSSGNVYVAGDTLVAIDLPARFDIPYTGWFKPPIEGGGPMRQDNYLAKFSSDGSLQWLVLFGGGSIESCAALAIDGSGNSYLTGHTESSLFPVTDGLATVQGLADSYVVKFSASGSLIYSRLFGGAGQEWGTGITADASGNAYVVGYTEVDGSGALFPTTTGAYQTAPTAGCYTNGFVLKLNSTGTTVFSTFLGDNAAQKVAVNSAGNAYVLSLGGLGFPRTGTLFGAADQCGAPDIVNYAYITKLNTAGSGLVYSKCSQAKAKDLALDASENLYIAGGTYGGLPQVNPAQAFGGFYDGFAMKFGADGTMLYSTYLGGADEENVSSIAVDATGAAYIAGKTWSNDFPAVAAIQATRGGAPASTAADGFLVKLSPSGAKLLFSSYLGGSNHDEVRGVAARGTSAYVAGQTYSSNFPVAANIQSYQGNDDGFVARIDIPCSTLAMSPASLPSGRQGTAYSQTLSVSGGTSPYWFEVTAGSLPTGLTLSSSGTISGTPATFGYPNVTIQAWDANGCGVSRTYSMTVAPVVDWPTGVDAQALTGNTSVLVTWNAVATATSYRVYRLGSDQIATSTSTSYLDTAVAPGNAYVYWVCAVNSRGDVSPQSHRDYATTYNFTDPTFTPQSTVIKAAHWTEVRAAVAGVYKLVFASDLTFTNATLNTSVNIRKQHIDEIRTALNSIRSSLGLGTAVYTDPSVVAATTQVKAAHLLELRNLLK